MIGIGLLDTVEVFAVELADELETHVGLDVIECGLDNLSISFCFPTLTECL